ncbi:hypothetical protein SAMN04488543_0714 [Friedmanniella luteola]|uniref:Uncharacterized protein n=1 Tax=Friedmanniella luteola TaxID=546871 RepID=A0A1H1MT35_9ACTN|nr:hypothetical protein SAMN04488543_0714 [Friedmanniella luteola]
MQTLVAFALDAAAPSPDRVEAGLQRVARW